MPKFSIVIPVYNSEKSLDELYLRIKKTFDETLCEEFEIILIDDASKDESYRIMESLHLRDRRVKVIQLAKNCGQHPAILCGFKYAKGDYIITMDDDLQHPPEEILKLREAILQSEVYDVIIGRYESKKHSLVRNLGTRLSNYISYKVYGKPKELVLTSFRIMKRFVVEDVLSLNIDSPRIGNMLLQVNKHIGNVTVLHDKRKYGKSGYSFFRLARDLASNLMTNSSFPLTLVKDIGIFSFVFSILLALYYLLRYFIRGVSIVGWTSLMLVVIFYSGLLLFSVGIMGGYLIRILNEAKKMPKYFVRKALLDDDMVEENEKSNSTWSDLSFL